MYIKRFLEGQISKYMSNKEIIAIVGPRQSGKTTLMRQIYNKLDNAKFIDFEDRELLELFTEDIKSFADFYVKKYRYLFIDEFQYAREGGKNLKYIYDNHKTKIIISGSSSSELSIQSIQYLVGRIFVFQLYPFSFGEFLSYKDELLFRKISKVKLSRPVSERILKYYIEFNLYGGYPRVILSNSEDEKKTVLKNIYNAYFLKEIKQILNLTTDYKLSKLINALALQIGGILNYNELSDISGFGYKDLLSHINILTKTFICVESKPFFKNKRTELIKSPKIYFVDSGFRNCVIKNFQSLEKRTDKGQLNENFVASELLKMEVALRYWRTKSKAEVDFIIEKNSQVYPVEIKSDLKRIKTTKSFVSFVHKYKPSIGYVLSESLFSNKQLLGSNVHFRPLFYIEKLIRQNRNT